MKPKSKKTEKLDIKNQDMVLKLNSVILCIIITLLIFLFPGCDKHHNQIVYNRFQHWDTLLEYQPEAVRDSLQLILPEKLSQANRAYYGLLKTIADDKTYSEFISDSLISKTVNNYSKSQPMSINHIRSLIYLGIVNIRMDKIDSTAFIPIKKADKLFTESKINNPLAGYLIHYHLGDLHFKNRNNNEANQYYTECLKYAKLEGKRVHIFDAYTALFWNEMTMDKKESGKMYLDKILAFENTSPQESYNRLNMLSAYYQEMSDFKLSLQYEMDMLELLPQVPYKVNEFRTLFSISEKYKKMNQVDSAMNYGLKAIQQIEDSTYKLNYLLYKNVADIALLKGNFKMAEEYRMKMFGSYKQSVNERVDKRILELEKRYNHNEAESKAFKAEVKTKILALFIFLLLLVISFILFAYSKHKKISKLKNDKLKAEKLNAETENLLLQNKTTEQTNIIRIYNSFLIQYSMQQQLLSTFESKFRGSRKNKHDLADDYKILIRQGEEQFKNLSNQLFLSEMFNNFIHLSKEQNFLKESDRLLIVMLALKLENSQITVFLNTNLNNLKSKKNYLKKKLTENASYIYNYEYVISLF